MCKILTQKWNRVSLQTWIIENHNMKIFLQNFAASLFTSAHWKLDFFIQTNPNKTQCCGNTPIQSKKLNVSAANCMQHNWLRRQWLPNQSHDRKHDIPGSTLLVRITLHVPCFETFLLSVYILTGNLKCFDSFDDSNLSTEGILYKDKRCRHQVY